MRKIGIWIAAALLMCCAGCSRNNDTKSGEKAAAGYRQISTAEAAAMMEKDDGHLVIDVRRADEYAEGHIPGAINIPNESIGSERPAELPDSGQILLVHCRSGVRSTQAAEKLAKFNAITTFTNAVIAVIIASLLYIAVRKRLKNNDTLKKIAPKY